MIRHSLAYVSWQDRRTMVGDLQSIYDAVSEDAARKALKDLKEKWDGQYPTIGTSWEANWARIVPFLAYPPMIRKAVYTTNAIEAAIRQIRKIIKTKGALPNDDAALKIIYLALRNAEKKSKMPLKEWNAAMNQFAIIFADRFPKN